ncbi:MAG: cyclic nucleotide-binding domain-containing protein [Kordiimonadaceae bacterium]|nr:cyclic nucleotide-binding domain-containing protein [Kordiimonadaceae bacterium]MBT6328159.1 cyclic nucleotide-binding domain-containing protein [Kordiimonadaceae bacterium]MBT7582109.1 cyclic nucleotide-binding domain-containing protein [Kordiimonadaceae bacterium]
MKESLIPLGRIMHEMQKERGCVILHLSSNLALDEEGIRQKFLESNYTVEELTAKLPQWKKEGKLEDGMDKKIANVLDEIKKISTQRDLVLTKEISATDSISVYSHKIIGPIIDLMIEVALNDPDHDSTHVSAYSNFLNLKERIGRERALGIRGLVTNSFSNEEFINNYSFLISEQDSYMDTFMALATPSQKACYSRYMNDYSVKKIDEMHKTLQDEKNGSSFDISPQDWYDLVSQKIDLMHNVETDLVATLLTDEQKTEKPEEKTDRLYVGLNSFSAKQQEFIQTLPLFKGLPEPTLADLFRNASVGSYKKGKLLFLEGELPNRLYIILDGWVKLYKGNSNGEETIVQMLTSGDMIAESAVFLNAPFPVSAQVAKSAQILTLPAPIIRENVKSNNALAINVLTAMSVHSQLLIQGLESIRLKSATERVGWFLLKLLLEQGRVPDMVELPYDKSLIASYLDMKPETFSRTLKKFKQKGFEIRKDAVILPQVKALCGFCDSDVAGICSRHGTDECPNPDCLSSKDEIIFYD